MPLPLKPCCSLCYGCGKFWCASRDISPALCCLQTEILRLKRRYGPTRLCEMSIIRHVSFGFFLTHWPPRDVNWFSCIFKLILQFDILSTPCPSLPCVNITDPNWWWVKMDSGNGLVPLLRPMLTQIYVAILCHWPHWVHSAGPGVGPHRVFAILTLHRTLGNPMLSRCKLPASVCAVTLVNFKSESNSHTTHMTFSNTAGRDDIFLVIFD